MTCSHATLTGAIEISSLGRGTAMPRHPPPTTRQPCTGQPPPPHTPRCQDYPKQTLSRRRQAAERSGGSPRTRPPWARPPRQRRHWPAPRGAARRLPRREARSRTRRARAAPAAKTARRVRGPRGRRRPQCGVARPARWAGAARRGRRPGRRSSRGRGRWQGLVLLVLLLLLLLLVLL